MSKAFTKESDDDGDDDLPETAVALPAGAKNYMTPAGHARMEAELRHLTGVERPQVVEVVSWAAGNGDRSENGDYLYGKKRLREIDRRVRYLLKRLEIAEVVDQSRQTNRDQVFFGATVTYADSQDGGRFRPAADFGSSARDETRAGERTVRIVGVDEARQEEGEVSWVSPVARALLKARVGDVVRVNAPAGIEEIEVVAIAYRGE